ncbi:RICIN domain-containing protein [Amycolatopsis sp. CA-126428]|uniref:RICIN domain-containing protein n=1 Tax=Amycolatopsis sp. CA-126428 TaxID=2073158 RepID=UPI001304A11F|nr:RICIN domain-containing protein [Amycolatopsis sp. CA-126428]
MVIPTPWRPAVPAVLTVVALGALTCPASAAVPESDHVYALQSVSTGKNADVRFDSLADGAAVVARVPNGNPNQLWQTVDAGNGTVTFVALNSGKCLDVSRGSSAPGAKLIQYTCHGGTNQAWTLGAPDAAGARRITSVRSGLCLDLDRATQQRLVQATCGTAGSQQWKLPERNRVPAWGPAQVAAGRAFTDQTVRMIAHTGVAGAGLRIRLSNLRSAVALDVGKVDVALRDTGGTTVAGSHRTVTFNRSTTPTLAAGAELESDVIPLAVTAGQDLVISVYLPGTTGASTYHANAHETTYISTAGDFTTDDALTNYTTTAQSWFYLAGLDVVAPQADSTVVAVGDSITDGSRASDGQNKRWPDFLARRLQAEPGGQRLAVANAGIGGNKVLSNAGVGQGQSLLARFAHDVLGEPGVKDVIIYEGINDLTSGKGTGGAALTADMFFTAFQSLIDQAHAKGVRVIGATIPPRNAHTAAINAIRVAVNDWILTSGAFDATVDLDLVLRDPATPTHLLPAYDSGDGLHPNDVGMEAIANAIDLSQLRS